MDLRYSLYRLFGHIYWPKENSKPKAPKKKSQQYIYGLMDPFGFSFFYIGRTNNPKIRLERHIKNTDRVQDGKHEMIEILKSCGLSPTMVILEEVCPEHDESEREARWLLKMLQLGFRDTLLNDEVLELPNFSFQASLIDFDPLLEPVGSEKWLGLWGALGLEKAMQKGRRVAARRHVKELELAKKALQQASKGTNSRKYELKRLLLLGYTTLFPDIFDQ